MNICSQILGSKIFHLITHGNIHSVNLKNWLFPTKNTNSMEIEFLLRGTSASSLDSI